MRAERPEIYSALPNGLGSVRQTLLKTISKQCRSYLLNNASADPVQMETDHLPTKVSTDAVSSNAWEMYQEVGLDVLTLSLLADVPIHRPLHLSQNSMIGHWRWLRQVWRIATPLSDLAKTQADLNPPEAEHEIIEAITQSRNNIAIALLRQSFQRLEAARPMETGDVYQSFLANLTLFCPFIGTELLWRQGLITAPKAEGLIE
ncbi:MAG: hypothetical protein RIB30_03230 [Thalassospira sp.]|uniref:hypothetical protein n=1 Tax=Thalassospira sp. TaxID=1912094 RepID=UPI0032EAF904